MKHTMRIGLAFLFGVFLLSPSVAGAVAINLEPSGWQQTITDPEEFASSFAYMDILNARHSYESGFHYFRMELAAPSSNVANYFIYITKGSGGGFPDPGDYRFGYSAGTSLALADPYAIVLEYGGANTNQLTWRTTAFDGTSAFTWWAATSNDSARTIDYTAETFATPIPGSAWLLGAGLVGLVGLRRRRAGK